MDEILFATPTTTVATQKYAAAAITKSTNNAETNASETYGPYGSIRENVTTEKYPAKEAETEKEATTEEVRTTTVPVEARFVG
ncbi:unnamed protein product [Anisakis simplex]|uniref:Uncharacterized protein n=1 Tax=Anisakis simplex TaxID=6269 RepID=A0A0M3J2Q3_ANISI|nr:unnamed protein product [Anisakis simplex]